MAKTKITHDGGPPFTVCLSDGVKLRPISPPYERLTYAKIFRKAFELGRAHPEPLYSFPYIQIEYSKDGDQ